MQSAVGKMEAKIDFETWVGCVDVLVCERTGSESNDLTAPYAEMWQQGISANLAARRAIASNFKPKPILQGDGDTFAFLCESALEVAQLPYYYLCGLQDQTHYADPIGAVALWMAGPFCAVGMTKAR